MIFSVGFLSGCEQQGSDADVREWSVDVISTLRLEEIGDETAGYGNVFLIVNVKVTNTGNDNNNVYAHMIKIEDMENKEYSNMEHYIAFHENVLNNQFNLNHFEGGYLNPNESLKGYVIYEVPELHRSFYIEINDPTARWNPSVFTALGDIGELELE
jgi:hypothetical protein